MKGITFDVFRKLLIYSIIPLFFLMIIFGLVTRDHLLESFDEMAEQAAKNLNYKIESEINTLFERIPQRLNHSIYRYGEVQDDLKYFIFRIKNLYDIYLIDKNGKIIKGESRYYYVEQHKDFNIGNEKYQIVGGDIVIKFEQELVNGQKVIYRGSVGDIFSAFAASFENLDIFLADRTGNIIYHSNPSIYLKRLSIKGLGILENSEDRVSGYYKFPQESGVLSERYVYVVKNIDPELIYGVVMDEDLINNHFKRIFLQLIIILIVYLFLIYLISKYLSNYISKPIVEIAKYSEESMDQDDVTLNIEKFPDNELRVLATNLERSIKTIKSLKNELFVTIMSIGDGVIVTDEQGIIEIMNPVAEKITGYVQMEAEGKHIVEVFKIFNEMTGDIVENPVIKAIRDKKVYGIANHTILKDKEGNQKIISDSASPIIINDVVKGGVLVFRDDTEKEKFKKEMIRKEQIETIGLVAGGIAHDFNNILAAINNYMLVAKIMCDENKKIEEIADNVISICGTGKFLANKLLVLSKGGEHISIVETDLYSLISETARFVLSGSNIKYSITKDDDFCYALVDQNLISQVFHNLFLNSKQAMPDGGRINISISMDQEVLINGKPSLKVIFEDNGPGISKDNLENVFNPFFTTKKSGSGLGLYIVKTIIDKHDGKIILESEIVKGVKFTIYLPSSDKCPVIISQAEKNSLKKDIDAKVLVMDDEFFIRDSLGLLLENLGCKVFFAEDGDEAYDIYEEHLKNGEKIDIVFLDITVPLGKGAKYAIDKIKKVDPIVNAVVMSGYTDSDIMENYKDYGFSDILSKPFEHKRVLDILKKIKKV